jgi:hypothetical protein
VKTPKLYFLDTGLAAWLLEIRDEEQLKAHPLHGALFETWAIVELIKGRANASLTSNLYFWRDRAGLEVDCVFDRDLFLRIDFGHVCGDGRRRRGRCSAARCRAR